MNIANLGDVSGKAEEFNVDTSKKNGNMKDRMKQRMNKRRGSKIKELPDGVEAGSEEAKQFYNSTSINVECSIEDMIK